MIYNVYSDYLKAKYGEKVYKLPVNLPITCPNRDGTCGSSGCIFGNLTLFQVQHSKMTIKQ